MIVLMMAVILTCFGVVMVYSASSVMAAKRFHDGFFFLKRQSLYALIGFIGMGLAMHVDYHVWKKWAVPLFLGTFFLLLLVFVPGIGGTAKGASRWIRLPGFNFQPSELAKVALIMYMAYSLEKRQEKLKQFMSGFFPYMLILGVFIAILLAQHDMGAALTMLVVAIVMLFAAGTKVQYILGMGLVTLPGVCYLVFTKAYRMRRITAFLDPWQDPTDAGFQIIQSWLALGTGGFFGQGLGEGKQKLFYLPEAHTDFILSVLGEEMGFIGVVVIASMFLLLVQRSIRVAIAAEDSFGRFLAFGIATLLGLEAFINMSVVTGLLPTKGIALPFLSYGGSSLIISLCAVGVLLNVSTRMRGTP
ncbi:putative lipid II flippase FtsW [Geomonas subterranea]|uniref:Probable peptidoglycan glycosyltransferase FtsW n=1 Tax=Geomonas subterranea TaxID=2847989 RepID=A0ABX8LMG7_9BACT|nr:MULTISPECIES: putative lipid II flippase FtsW [Geomonas]QXE93082.1 putative lipid II flippase FtsW [Geomonas subterranea]QXM11680.1 putative lipid II flippase FtsW [Geomonas subterranea]